MEGITYALLSSDDIPTAIEIERRGSLKCSSAHLRAHYHTAYPVDEAASLDAFQYASPHIACDRRSFPADFVRLMPGNFS